jgi:hypothetical protein
VRRLKSKLAAAPAIICCPVCGEPCGKQYPDMLPTWGDAGEAGYREGVGEDFDWHCSQECMEEDK